MDFFLSHKRHLWATERILALDSTATRLELPSVVQRRRLTTAGRQRTVPLSQSVMEHLFHCLSLCLTRTVRLEDDSKCAFAFSYRPH